MNLNRTLLVELTERKVIKSSMYAYQPPCTLLGCSLCITGVHIFPCLACILIRVTGYLFTIGTKRFVTSVVTQAKWHVSG